MNLFGVQRHTTCNQTNCANCVAACQTALIILYMRIRYLRASVETTLRHTSTGYNTRIDSLGLYAMTAVQVRAHAHSTAFVSQTELLQWQCAVIPCSPALCRTWHCVVESDPKFQNDARHPCHPCHPSEATGLFRILRKTILTALMLTAVKHPLEIL